MKIAIPASEKNINSLIDERFGRCLYFCIYNRKSGETRFMVNEISNAAGGVGPKVAGLLAEEGIAEVVALEVGPKAKKILDKLKIKITVVDKILPLGQIINKL